MRKIISKKIIESPKPPQRFALFPTLVGETHPTESRVWLIWWEWYEIKINRKWLIKLTK